MYEMDQRCADASSDSADTSSENANASLAGHFADEAFAVEDERSLHQGRALAELAWEFREEADTALAGLVTDWPTHRQPVVDRNVLRLAFYEMSRGGVPHAAAIDQAVELAREFGGERSPAFVNAVLDRWWKSRDGAI